MATQDDSDVSSGFVDRLGQEAREDYRMIRDDAPLTEEQIETVVEAAKAYLDNRRFRNKAYSLADFALEVGIGRAVLSRVLNKTYDSDVTKHVLRLDAFLADQVKREGRCDFAAFVKIGVAETAFGVIRTAKTQNSIGVIIMEPGSGKSTIARAYASDDPGAILIRASERLADNLGVVGMLYKAMGLSGGRTYRDRFDAVAGKMHRSRSMIVLIDEAQKLAPTGLEVVRDLHDLSDPSGEFPVPFVLFGDRDFYRLIVKARNGEPSPIKAQMTSRMSPIWDVEKSGVANGGGLGAIYTPEDLKKVLRNRQLRLVSEKGIRWLCAIANTPGWGRLRIAKRIVSLAYAIKGNDAEAIDVQDLRTAMEMLITPEAVEEIDAQTDGVLSVKSAAVA